jgi:hypothetical protein
MGPAYCLFNNACKVLPSLPLRLQGISGSVYLQYLLELHLTPCVCKAKQRLQDGSILSLDVERTSVHFNLKHGGEEMNTLSSSVAIAVHH